MSGKNRLGVSWDLCDSIVIAASLLIMDIGFSGCFFFSLLVGPIWLLFEIVRAVVWRRNWLLSIKRIVVVLVTLGLGFGNGRLQSRMARTNAELIVHACMQYKANNGHYPKALGDLVPMYLPSVPHSKYALAFRDYLYVEGDGLHKLMWVETPPFGRPFYDFETNTWGYLD